MTSGTGTRSLRSFSCAKPTAVPGSKSASNPLGGGLAPTLTLLATTAPTTGTWPKVLVTAMSYVASRTQVPLEAPSPLPVEEISSFGGPPVQAGPNTAQAEAQKRSYSVSLYNCPQALPLNSSRFELSCEAPVTILGVFGGGSYASPTAALSALSASERVSAQRPASCDVTRQVRLRGAVVAEVYTSPASGNNCLAHWQEHGWEFVLTGFFATDNGWGSWPATADQLVGYVTSHRLPAAHGLLDCDIAGDGLPTTLIWALGAQTYTASTYHSALGSIDMADAMSPYTARARSRRP